MPFCDSHITQWSHVSTFDVTFNKKRSQSQNVCNRGTQSKNILCKKCKCNVLILMIYKYVMFQACELCIINNCAQMKCEHWKMHVIECTHYNKYEYLRDICGKLKSLSLLEQSKQTKFKYQIFRIFWLELIRLIQMSSRQLYLNIIRHLPWFVITILDFMSIWVVHT